MTQVEMSTVTLDRPLDRTGLSHDPANAGQMVEFVSFAVDDEQYGVEITDVREIKGWTGVTHLPKQPDYVRGVLNLRGAMVPIIDLRCRFGRGTTEATPLHVMIIVQIGDTLVGILADRVLDIVSVEAAQIQAVPRVARDQRSELFSGLVTVEEGMIALIDLRHLIDQNDGNASMITAAAAGQA
jgi:purine-binding chemotaxis protein CheW